jgi:hypothetical protein
MVGLSKELEESLYGDEAVLRYLQIVKDAFDSGDREALFGVISLCAQYQAIIPDWAADEIIKIERLIEVGELKDYNEAFGFKPENVATRKKQARIAKFRPQVLARIQHHRLEGASLNADDILATVADELGISRRDVEDIYKMHGGFLKDLPRGNPDKAIYAIANIVLPTVRRYGRPILKDK